MRGKAITELWAWVCTEADGTEGVPAVDANGMALPLFGADAERMRSLRPYALQVAHMLGRPVQLRRFTAMEVVEQVGEPRGD